MGLYDLEASLGLLRVTTEGGLIVGSCEFQKHPRSLHIGGAIGKARRRSSDGLILTLENVTLLPMSWRFCPASAP